MKIRPTVCMVKSGLDRFFFCEIVPRLFSFLQIDFTSIYLPSKMEIWLTLKLNKTEYFFCDVKMSQKFPIWKIILAIQFEKKNALSFWCLTELRIY